MQSSKSDRGLFNKQLTWSSTLVVGDGLTLGMEPVLSGKFLEDFSGTGASQTIVVVSNKRSLDPMLNLN